MRIFEGLVPEIWTYYYSAVEPNIHLSPAFSGLGLTSNEELW